MKQTGGRNQGGGTQGTGPWGQDLPASRFLLPAESSGPVRHKIRILIVEDDAAAARNLVDALGQAPGYSRSSAGAQDHREPPDHPVHDDPVFNFETAATMNEALTLTQGAGLSREKKEAEGSGPLFDIVIADLILPDGDAIELTKKLKASTPSTEIIILTGQSSVETAVAAMTAGARTYLKKPVSLAELRAVVAKSVEVIEMRRELRQLHESDGIARILGDSAAMIRLRDEILTVAQSSVPVLILGESGTGKDLVARALHFHSGRKGSFVAVNAAALSPSIIESEIFGHVRGAFTGAVRDHEGCFERADGGTLFLDEIGALPIELQPKFLRAIECSEILRVGGEKLRSFNSRLVAATNHDLRGAIRDGAFRRDLFHRLSVATIEIPPLRNHPEDIAALADVFLRMAADLHQREISFEPDALGILERHDFPGNVRELKNAVEAALLFSRGKTICAEEIRQRLDIMSERTDAPGTDLPESEKAGSGNVPPHVSRPEVEAALKKTHGNRREAAQRLGVSERTLYRYLKNPPLS